MGWVSWYDASMTEVALPGNRFPSCCLAKTGISNLILHIIATSNLKIIGDTKTILYKLLFVNKKTVAQLLKFSLNLDKL